MRYFKKISDYAITGGLGALLVLGLSGCESRDNSNNNMGGNQMSDVAKKEGAFVVIEKNPDGGYAILQEFPSDKTTIVLRENGTEKILSQDEIDKLLKEEEARINAGTSELTNPTGGGLSLGEAILASAAGAILGSFIGNRLFGNQNYQQSRERGYKSPQAYERSKNSFNQANSGKTSTTKSGFYGNNKPSTTTNSNTKSGFYGTKSDTRSYGG